MTSPHPPRVIVLCPLEIERKTIARALTFSTNSSFVEVHCCGPGAAAVRRWMRSNAPRKPSLIVLAGVCGALDASCDAGRAYLIESVRSEDGQALHSAVHSPAASTATITSTEHSVTDAAAKRDLAERSGAQLVDFESAMFAQTAEDNSLRWAIVRGVSDGVDDALPRSIDTWVDVHGRTRPLRVITELIVHPHWIGRVRSLQQNTTRALRDAARVLQDVINYS